MKIVQQPLTVPILTFAESHRQQLRHNELFPSTIRCVLCGPSNCGKTTALISLLFSENGLKFENVYIYSKSLYQPMYQLLQKVLEQVKGVGYYPFSENEDVIDPSEAKENSVFIFDDVVCDKQDKIRAHFSMGRHKNLDLFYLVQSFAKCEKHCLRDNLNMLVLFKQDNLNLKHVYDDHVNTDMSFGDFQEMCRKCWKDKHGFLVIYKDNDLDKGRYRKGFDNFIYI